MNLKYVVVMVLGVSTLAGAALILPLSFTIDYVFNVGSI